MIRFERSLGHEVFLLTGSGVVKDEFEMKSRFLKREINPIFDVLAWYEIYRSVKHVNPDLIHTHESKAGILGRLNLTGRHRVLAHTVHMATFSEKWFQFSPIANISQVLEYLASKRTDLMFFVGSELSSIYKKKKINGKVSSTVVRSFLDIESFVKASNRLRDKEIVLDELLLPASTKIILSVGLLEKRKNHSFMIRSLAQLLESNDDVHLLFAGTGYLQKSLELLCKKLKVSQKVHFLGYRNDIPRLMNSADVLIHASRREGVPQVIVQAIASNVPVVSLQTCGIKELRDVTVVADGAKPYCNAVEGILLDPKSRFQIRRPPEYLESWAKIEIEKTWESKLIETENILKIRSREGLGN
jgi:glycosyltransferase involved in cell wall biosynthesis